MDELRALAKLINDAVDQIDSSCSARGVTFPSLADPFSPQSEAARMDSDVLQSSANIVAAAAQLTAIVRPPSLTLMISSVLFHIPSSIRFAIEANVVEILRDAGPKGLHVNEIARMGNVNADKLSRALRLLATEHIFAEVEPDVFVNNRISSVLDTGKGIEELVAKPNEKHVGTSCAAALMTHFTSHVFKSSAFLTEAMLDKDFANSFDVNKTAFNLAFDTKLSIWDWFGQPNNEADQRLINQAMAGATNLVPQDVILNGFEWGELPKGSVVVEVGGGVGSQTLKVAQAYPHLRYTIQDREQTIPQAKQFWMENHPEAIANGLVTLQASDFFKAQPITDASVFFMRMILHDWADAQCTVILKNLRAAARPDTRLLIIDIVLSHASPPNDAEDSDGLHGIPGTDALLPPKPLLPNAGHASAYGFLCDMQMLTLMNGKERTLKQLNALLVNSGWKLVRVYPMPYFAGGHQQVVAQPA